MERPNYYNNPGFVVRTPEEDEVIRASTGIRSGTYAIDSPAEAAPGRAANFVRGVVYSLARAVRMRRTPNLPPVGPEVTPIHEAAAEIPPERVEEALAEVIAEGERRKAIGIIVDTAIPDRAVELRLTEVMAAARGAGVGAEG